MTTTLDLFPKGPTFLFGFGGGGGGRSSRSSDDDNESGSNRRGGGAFGFDSVRDMFDGGGAGRSGSTHSFEGSSFDRDGENNYSDPNDRGGDSSGGDQGGNAITRTLTGNIFGFDNWADMVNGGGAGRSGSSFSTEGSSWDDDGQNDYVDPLTQEEIDQFNEDNPNSTIDAQTYYRRRAFQTAIGPITPTLGLGSAALTRLQRGGYLGGSVPEEGGGTFDFGGLEGRDGDEGGASSYVDTAVNAILDNPDLTENQRMGLLGELLENAATRATTANGAADYVQRLEGGVRSSHLSDFLTNPMAMVSGHQAGQPYSPYANPPQAPTDMSHYATAVPEQTGKQGFMGRLRAGRRGRTGIPMGHPGRGVETDDRRGFFGRMADVGPEVAPMGNPGGADMMPVRDPRTGRMIPGITDPSQIGGGKEIRPVRDVNGGPNPQERYRLYGDRTRDVNGGPNGDGGVTATGAVGNAVAETTATPTSPLPTGPNATGFAPGQGPAGLQLQGHVPAIDPYAAGTHMNPFDPRFNADPAAIQAQATHAQAGQAVAGQAVAGQGEATTAGQITPQQATGYDAALSADQVAQNGQMTAAQGTVSDQAQVTAEQHDIQGAATGVNADGTTNHLGEALNDAAQQGLEVVDTSTPEGQARAAELGEGNYTDAKATVRGQMNQLSADFVDAEGNPKIPSWAAEQARGVSRIASFSGMTGTAATAAMAQAIMEASLPMAQADAAFFQTLTRDNLNNRQQSTINQAQVLANLSAANLDARTQAAVVNAQAFLKMDLTNLSNEQQAEVINTQARVQSLLEDARSVNASRLFGAEAENDMARFYDQMAAQIEQFNAAQINAMEQFNAGQATATSQFNAGQQTSVSQFNAGQRTSVSQFNAGQDNAIEQFNSQLENQREQFYAEMGYNVMLSNVNWRRTVETENTQRAFQAAQVDVQNLFGLNQLALSQLWDREDAALDYAWRTADNEAQRQIQIYQADRNYNLNARQLANEEDAARGAGVFEVINTGLRIGNAFGIF